MRPAVSTPLPYHTGLERVPGTCQETGHSPGASRGSAHRPHIRPVTSGGLLWSPATCSPPASGPPQALLYLRCITYLLISFFFFLVSLSEGRGYVFGVVFPVSKTEANPNEALTIC